MWGSGYRVFLFVMGVRQARQFLPFMFMAQEPHIPSLQDLLNAKVGSISFLIRIRASRTMGPQSDLGKEYFCIWVLAPTVLYILKFHIYLLKCLIFKFQKPKIARACKLKLNGLKSL